MKAAIPARTRGSDDPGKAGGNRSAEARAFRTHNAIVAASRLSTLELVESRFERRQSKAAAKGKATFTCEPTLSDTQFDDDAGLCLTTVTWTIKASLPASETGFTLRAAYRVGYDGLSSQPAEDVISLVEHLAKFACFPYFRSHVAHVVAAAGMHLPPLPVLKGHVRRPVPNEKVRRAR